MNVNFEELMKRYYLYILLFLISYKTICQTIGGAAVFNFVNQSNCANLSALGGVNISSIKNSVGLAFNNPALLRNNIDKKYEASFNSFFAGIKHYNFIASKFFIEKNIALAGGINYFNYGNITETDAAGNVLGSINLNDFVVQIQVAKQHKENWFYGSTLKLISSNYGTYKSNGIAVDVGLCYFDSAKNLQFGLVIKNIGTQLITYTNSDSKTEIPFDIQFGFTKKIEKAPFQFSITAQHLQALNTLYNDTLFNAQEGDVNYKNSNGLKKILAHLIVATEVFIGDKIKASISYNFSRGNDLKIYQSTYGLSGCNLGLSMLLKKFNFHYATGFYQQNMYHHVSISF
jgi:hypothetical protein